MPSVCALLHALAARGEREGFPIQAAMVMCYMDLSKLLHGFVKVVTWIGQCFSLYCICSRWGEGFPSQTGCDGYVRVSAGYLQVMGSTRTPPD